jgi:raffinose/stachyose/melibiose transport system permease protein
MALTFLSGDTWRTVPVGMMNFLGEHGTSYPHINAGVLVSIIPVIAVYLGLQKHFVSGMISGAIKQ